MTRLAKSKSWNFSLNNRCVGANANESCKIAMLLQKNTLVSWGWTVVRSCDKTNIADADLWNTIADVNWGYSTGVRSWTVLQHPLHTMQICFFLTSYSSNNSHKWQSIYLSWSGDFSGGATNSAPTAGDRITLLEGGFTNDSAVPVVLHMMQSTDQSCTRLLRLASNKVENAMFFETLADTRAEIPKGILFVAGGLSDGYTYANFQRISKFRGLFNGADDSAIRLASLGVSAVGLGETWNTLNRYNVIPYCEIYPYTLTHKVILGKMQDLWFGPTLSANNGTPYPSATEANQFAQFNHFVFPWDGSIPVIA